MLRYKGEICPTIQHKVEALKEATDAWLPIWSGDNGYSLFEVTNGIEKYVINLGAKKCSCRRMDLSGIPCCHAVSCIWYNNYSPKNFVDTCLISSIFTYIWILF